MADQEIMNGARSKSGEELNGLMENISSFGADIATLAVLQARLAACDLRDELRRKRLAVVTMTICAMLGATGIVVITLGAAFWLSAAFQINIGQAMILVGVASLIIALAVSAPCVRMLAIRESVFRRSHEELERNLAWIRTALAQSGR